MRKTSLGDLTGYAAKAAAGERPFRYSDEYYDWHEAALRGHADRINDTHERWLRRFGITIPRPGRRPRRAH